MLLGLLNVFQLLAESAAADGVVQADVGFVSVAPLLGGSAVDLRLHLEIAPVGGWGAGVIELAFSVISGCYIEKQHHWSNCMPFVRHTSLLQKHWEEHWWSCTLARCQNHHRYHRHLRQYR